MLNFYNNFELKKKKKILVIDILTILFIGISNFDVIYRFSQF